MEIWSGYVNPTGPGLEMNQLVKVYILVYLLVGFDFEQCMIHNCYCPLPLFTIVAVCGFLPDPENGSVTISGPTLGSVATYSCDTGYDLIGDMERVCQDNGTWSGNQPVCQS